MGWQDDPEDTLGMSKHFSDTAKGCADCAAQGFTLDESGCVQGPGKFEGEPLATYHAYHAMLDGGADEDCGGAWLIGNMVCSESEQGFVSCEIYSHDGAARADLDRRRSHDALDEDEEEEGYA